MKKNKKIGRKFRTFLGTLAFAGALFVWFCGGGGRGTSVLAADMSAISGENSYENHDVVMGMSAIPNSAAEPLRGFQDMDALTLLYIDSQKPRHEAEKVAAQIAANKEVAEVYGLPWDATINTEVDPSQVTEDTVYSITVNCEQNIVTVYIGDSSGDAAVPLMAFICSAGQVGHGTFEGHFSIGTKYRWRLMVDNSYAQYVTRFYQGIMFHSIPYAKKSGGSMILEDYELLGTRASLGCIRLSTLDAKWIYENCDKGTAVTVYYDTEKEEPLERPTAIPLQISSEEETYGWDPTDPDEANPYNAS